MTTPAPPGAAALSARDPVRVGLTDATPLTRAQIAQLGGASGTGTAQPWAFLPHCIRSLGSAPDDAPMRFLAAMNFARLGLTELSSRQLDRLPPAALLDPNAQELRTLLGTMAPSRADPGVLRKNCAGNLMALAMRGIDLRAHLPAWTERQERVETYCADDGNIVRVERSPEGPCWLLLADARSQVARLDLDHLRRDPRGAPTPPVTVEGADPIWLLARVLELTDRPDDAQQVRVTLIQADVIELLDGLSLVPMAGALMDPRLEVFAGPDASERYEASLLARLDTRCIGPILRSPGLRERAAPSPASAVGRVKEAQSTEHEMLRARVHERYAGRDRAWMNDRLRKALALGPDEPLRVLIPTSRHTTYVQHSAEDLAGAIRQRGHEARVLRERNETDSMSSVAYLRAIESFEPDLIIAINYTRRAFASFCPDGLPVVAWVQDAMLHLFEPTTADAQGELDVLLGHLDRVLFASREDGGMGYDASRARNLPVLASATKFHARPCNRSLEERLACEVMFASHHAEAPDALHRRKLKENASTPQMCELLEVLRPRVERSLREPGRLPRAETLGRITTEVLESFAADHLDGAQPTREDAAKLHNTYTMQLADRLLRHESLSWASEICERRGWRLHLYGRGWDAHPTLSRHAKGELPHDETLRAAYRSARASLSLTAHTPVHQRVMECALSGGLPIVRRHAGIVDECLGWTQHELAREATPAASRLGTREHGFRIADHPSALSTIALYQRIGLRSPFPWTEEPGQEDARAFWWIGEGSLARRRRDAKRHANTHNPAALLGDPALVSFSDRASLERLLERSIEDDAWRAATSAMIARRVREGFTIGTLLDNMTEVMLEPPTDD